MDPLISTEGLAAGLAEARFALLDATLYMPGDPRSARGLFEAARIPGARFFDIDQISDRHSRLPHMVPSADFFAQCMSELGIANTDRVVVYD